MRKICVFTGTRAEYGLLYWLMKEIQDDPEMELQVLVSGSHLSPEFGLTYQVIEKDGFRINEKVEMLLSSDTPTGVSKSMGLGLISYAEALERLKPDVLVVLGDRFELFAVSAAAMMLKVPVAHLHGGEATEGAIDESIRHSITKMAHLHFTSTGEYRRRVVQLGEQPGRVFNVGALGIDNIKKLQLLDRQQFEEKLGFKLGKRNILVTFHPVTLENATAGAQFRQLLEALDELEDTHVIITKPNADADGRAIIKLIDEYVQRNPEKAYASISLGQLLYLSAMQICDCVAGNSSSGILEAPSFRKATLNIGDRQQGRIQAESVVNCSPYKEDILEAFEIIFSTAFQQKIKNTLSPYGEGGAAVKIKQVLKTYPLDNIIRKRFHDIKFTLE